MIYYYWLQLCTFMVKCKEIARNIKFMNLEVIHSFINADIKL